MRIYKAFVWISYVNRLSTLATYPHLNMAPAKMKAIVTSGGGNIELKEIDVPKPGPKEALVKVVAAAQNPADCEYHRGHRDEGQRDVLY